MAENSESNAVLGFVVGAIVVALLVFVFFVVIPGGSATDANDGDIDVKIEMPDPAPSDNSGG